MVFLNRRCHINMIQIFPKYSGECTSWFSWLIINNNNKTKCPMRKHIPCKDCKFLCYQSTAKIDWIFQKSINWNALYILRSSLFLLAPQKNQTITATFTEFGTECSFDFLYVFDGGSYKSPLLGRFTGNNLPDIITSTSSEVSYPNLQPKCNGIQKAFVVYACETRREQPTLHPFKTVNSSLTLIFIHALIKILVRLQKSTLTTQNTMISTHCDLLKCFNQAKKGNLSHQHNLTC